LVWWGVVVVGWGVVDAFAENFKAVQYARLDPRSTDRHETVTGDIVLDNVKHALQGGFPVIFGFTVYNSINNAPDIPYPRRGDKVSGGHAIMAVGYDDNHRTAAGEDEPSLIIRNSWGTGWGDGGYGYLPYRYLLKGLAQDFWAVFEWKWVDQGQFE
jgi:C1A family cysteine protease